MVEVSSGSQRGEMEKRAGVGVEEHIGESKADLWVEIIELREGQRVTKDRPVLTLDPPRVPH